MLHGKSLLGLILLVLTFIASNTALPALEKRGMECSAPGTNNVKICRDNGKKKLYGMAFDGVNNIFYGGLPSDKKYREFSFCVKVACGAMKSISGTEFTPKNYESVARRARQHWLNSVNCIGDGSMGLDFFYSSAVDVYMPNDNFVFSWWINEFPLITGSCPA